MSVRREFEMNKWPDVIWLHADDGTRIDGAGLYDATWSATKIDDDDARYVRLDGEERGGGDVLEPPLDVIAEAGSPAAEAAAKRGALVVTMDEAVAKKLPVLDWTAAREHLEEYAGAYFLLPDHAGMFGLIGIGALRDRYNAEERTAELHAEIMAVS